MVTTWKDKSADGGGEYIASNMLDVPNFFWDSEPTLHPLYIAVRGMFVYPLILHVKCTSTPCSCHALTLCFLFQSISLHSAILLVPLLIDMTLIGIGE